MRKYFARDYPTPFVLFGPAHLAFIAFALALNASWFWLRAVPDEDLRWAVRVTMAVILLASEFVYHLWIWRTGRWTLAAMLPLHLCSLLVYSNSVMRKPDTPSLLDHLGPWPWYLAPVTLLALACILLMYVPFLFF